MTLYLGPAGRMIGLRDPQGGVTVPHRRGVREMRLLSGSVAVQVSPRMSRTWELTWPWLDGDELADLLALFSGALGQPPWWLYDPAAAATNMLPSAAAVPGLMGDWSQVEGLSGHGGAITLGGGDGRVVASSAIVAAAGSLETGLLACHPSTTYTASAWASQVSGSVEVSLRWFTEGGVLISFDTGSAASGAGTKRATVTAAAPSNAALVSVAVGASTSQASITALQLTETTAPVRWQPGRGICQVAPAGDLEETYERITAAGPESSITVPLVEVQ